MLGPGRDGSITDGRHPVGCTALGPNEESALVGRCFWEGEHVAGTEAVVPRRQRVRLVDGDLSAPAAQSESVGYAAREPVFHSVAEQPGVLKDREDGVCGTRNHGVGFVGVRVGVNLAVRASRLCEEAGRVGDSEVTPHSHRDTHAIYQRIVANDRYLGHANIVRGIVVGSDNDLEADSLLSLVGVRGWLASVLAVVAGVALLAFALFALVIPTCSSGRLMLVPTARLAPGE
jgi:hypothetical protein